MKTATIYTDGGCFPNPGGPGGAAAVVLIDGKPRELAQGYIASTNNRMELRAAIMALESLPDRFAVSLFSDSKYLVKAISLNWPRTWERNGWVRKPSKWDAEGGPVKNPDLWRLLLIQMQRHVIVANWVKGHAGNRWNERADELATLAARGHRIIDDGFQTLEPCRTL